MRRIVFILLAAVFFLSCQTDEVKITDARVSVYPNPFNYQINIDIQAIESAAVEVNVYGELGQPNDPQIQYLEDIPDKNPVIQETLSPTENGRYQLVASGWDSGTYIMEVTINGKTERFNLLKE